MDEAKSGTQKIDREVKLTIQKRRERGKENLSRRERASAGRVEEDTEVLGLATGNEEGIGLER